MGFLKEFKVFISRGNVIDLAVGIIIGGAFSSITTSLVNNIIMPPLGIIIAGINFSKLLIELKPAVVDEAGKVVTEAVAINYGLFIQAVINFLIIAFVIFLMVKGINSLRRKQEEKEVEAVAEVAPPTMEERLLTEIRDLLAKK